MIHFNKSVLLLHFLILFSFVLSPNKASVVNSIGGKCEDLFPTSPCKNIIEYTSIYIPNNTTQLNIQTFVNGTFNNLTFAPIECRPQGQLFACLRNYKPCVLINTTTVPVPLPSFPCRSECNNVYKVCETALHLRDPNFSCSMKFPDGDDQFPTISTQYNLQPLGGPLNVSVQCNSGGSSINTELGCSDPLVKVTNITDKDRLYYFVSDTCALPCPFQIYTKPQQRALNSVTAIRALSFIGSVYLLLTFGIIANEITIKNEIILYFAFGNLLYCISFIIAETQEGDFRCSTVPGRYKSQENDWICGLDGFLLQFGALSMLFWITVFSFDFFLTIKRVKNTLFKYQRIVVYILISVLSVVPAITKNYEITLATDTCWLSVDSTLYQYVFFNVPAFISLILIFSFTIYSIIQISKIYKLAPNRDIIYFNIKNVIFITLVLFIFVMFLSFKLYSDGKKYVPVIRDFLLCSAAHNGDDSNCKPISLPGFALRFVTLLCTSSFGLVGLFGYGTDRSVKQIYRESWKVKSIFRIFGKEWSTGSSSLTSNENTTNQSKRSMKLRSLKLNNPVSSIISDDSLSSRNAESNIDSSHSIDHQDSNPTPTINSSE